MGEENREPAMSQIRDPDAAGLISRPRRLLVYRHARITRLSHWINLLCVIVLLEPDAFRFVHILHLRSSLYIPLRCRFREVGRWLR
jgi:hypothetical protein